MNAARRLITGLRRGYSLAELEVAADRALMLGHAFDDANAESARFRAIPLQ